MQLPRDISFVLILYEYTQNVKCLSMTNVLIWQYSTHIKLTSKYLHFGLNEGGFYTELSSSSL